MNDALSEPERNGSGEISASSYPAATTATTIASRRSAVRAIECVLGQLHPAQRAVVADAEHAVAESLHRELRAVDLRQDLGVDRGAVRNARSETGGRRLLGARDAERTGELAHLLLADSGVDQRMDDRVLGGGSQAGPPVAEVVGVRAGEHGRVATTRGERQ